MARAGEALPEGMVKNIYLLGRGLLTTSLRCRQLPVQRLHGNIQLPCASLQNSSLATRRSNPNLLVSARTNLHSLAITIPLVPRIFDQNLSKPRDSIGWECWAVHKIPKIAHKVGVFKDGISATTIFLKKIPMGFPMSSRERLSEITNPDLRNYAALAQ